MYVNNGKISSRQTFRLYVFDLMGIATLLLPPYLAKLCGCDGLWAIAIGSGLGFVYLLYLNWVMKRMGSDMCAFLEEKKHNWVRFSAFALIGAHSIFTAGFCACIFSRLMQYSLVENSSYEVLLFVIVITSVYAVSGGIECRARVYEVLFWFVLIPYVAMMLASVRDFEISYMDEFITTSPINLMKGSYLVFLFLTPLFFLLFLVREKEKKTSKSVIVIVAGALMITSIILLGSYALLVGNFGVRSLATMRFPVVTLMSTVQFEGTFLKRMDALMVAVWFFTLFALLNLHLHYGVKMCRELSKKADKTKGYTLWTVVIPAVIVYAVAWVMEHYEAGIFMFLNYYSYVAVPLMIIGPGILLLGGRERRKCHKE